MIVTVSITQESRVDGVDAHLQHSVAFGTIDATVVTLEQFKQAVATSINKVGEDARQKGWVV